LLAADEHRDQTALTRRIITALRRIDGVQDVDLLHLMLVEDLGDGLAVATAGMDPTPLALHGSRKPRQRRRPDTSASRSRLTRR
jgi:hypothetical protein